MNISGEHKHTLSSSKIKINILSRCCLWLMKEWIKLNLCCRCLLPEIPLRDTDSQEALGCAATLCEYLYEKDVPPSSQKHEVLNLTHTLTHTNTQISWGLGSFTRRISVVTYGQNLYVSWGTFVSHSVSVTEQQQQHDFIRARGS